MEIQVCEMWMFGSATCLCAPTAFKSRFRVQVRNRLRVSLHVCLRRTHEAGWVSCTSVPMADIVHFSISIKASHAVDPIHHFQHASRRLASSVSSPLFGAWLFTWGHPSSQFEDLCLFDKKKIKDLAFLHPRCRLWYWILYLSFGSFQRAPPTDKRVKSDAVIIDRVWGL